MTTCFVSIEPLKGQREQGYNVTHVVVYRNGIYSVGLFESRISSVQSLDMLNLWDQRDPDGVVLCPAACAPNPRFYPNSSETSHNRSGPCFFSTEPGAPCPHIALYFQSDRNVLCADMNEL